MSRAISMVRRRRPGTATRDMAGSCMAASLPVCGGRDQGRLHWWAAMLLAAAVLLAPLLIADVPPVLDYPNHLARFVLLAAGPDDPVLGRIFTPRWSIIPNLATDLIMPPLLHVVPVHIAGRLLLGGIL